MQLFGILPTGEEIYKFTLKSEDCEATVISYGARIASFRPFGRDIVAGFDELSCYTADKWFHGATVGRVCNRIVGGYFDMDGVRYELTKNNGENCLHGGTDNVSIVAWDVLSYSESSVTLGYTSPEGASGFPGKLDIRAEFTLEGSALTVKYTATPDKKTPVMMTNHAYFNLEGFGGEVYDHEIEIYADEYTAISPERIPIGRRKVRGSELDFSSMRKVGNCALHRPEGYDNNFVLADERREAPKLAAVVCGGGLKLSLYTDQPGVQLYIPRSGMKAPLRDELMLVPYGSFCLEPQIEPNCVQSGRGFVEAGESFNSTTVYKVEKI